MKGLDVYTLFNKKDQLSGLKFANYVQEDFLLLKKIEGI